MFKTVNVQFLECFGLHFVLIVWDKQSELTFGYPYIA